MSETVLQTQVRLVLEQQCADMFMKVLAPAHRKFGWNSSLFCFDQGDQGNVAYKSSLPLPALIDTVDRLGRGPWATGGQRFVNARRVISMMELAGLADDLKTVCPAGVAFALLVGGGDDVMYIASCEREGVAEIFGKLVEAWKADIASERRAQN